MCARKRPKLVGPFSVLMHNPPLADAVNRVVDAIRKDGKLEKRLYELIVLIVARHGAGGLCLGGARSARRAAGLSGDVVDALQAERKPTFAKADERAIYDAITELLDDQQDQRRQPTRACQGIRPRATHRSRLLRRALLHDRRA